MNEVFLRLSEEYTAPEIEKPAAEKLISGDPVFTTWNLEQTADELYCGIWQSTPGKWHVSYDEWEYCRGQQNLLSYGYHHTEDANDPQARSKMLRTDELLKRLDEPAIQQMFFEATVKTRNGTYASRVLEKLEVLQTAIDQRLALSN